MASVYRQKKRNGKTGQVWRFKYLDYTGKWRYGTGWPDQHKTLRHAQELEAEHRAIRRGEKPLPSLSKPDFLKPVADVIAEYIAWGRVQGGRNGRPWDDTNARKKEKHLEWWIDELGLRVLSDIRLEAVEKSIQGLLASGKYAPKSVALRLEPLRCLCYWGVRRGLLPSNPLAALAKVPGRAQKPHRPLIDSEVKALLEAAPAERRLWYEVALATGYRAGELKALRVRDLDLAGPTLPLGADYTKNRKDARQPITRDLADRLAVKVKEMPQDAPLLGMPIHSDRAIRTDLTKAKVKLETSEGKASWHSLRKWFVNAILLSGADPKTAMELARHSTASLTMEVYASTDATRLRKAAEAAANNIPQVEDVDPCCAYVAHDENTRNGKNAKHLQPRQLHNNRPDDGRWFKSTHPDHLSTLQATT